MFLITTDIHLNDKPRDAYRYGLFPWLVKQQEKYNPVATFILGDLTDAKDRHSSMLVNNLVNGLDLLKSPIYILKGNHDYINEENPFFGFLTEIPGLHFFVHPAFIHELGVYMLPHQPNQGALDLAFKQAPDGGLIMMHQTLAGAISETGGALNGFVRPPASVRAVLSGDVHKPQVTNGVTYVGAPYHVRFGDRYEPRVMLFDPVTCKGEDLHFPAPKKYSLTIRSVDELTDLKPGDQVKLSLELTRAEMVDWVGRKRQALEYCRAHGIEVHGIEPKVPARKRIYVEGSVSAKTNLDYLKAFCKAENTSEGKRQVGISLMEHKNA